MVYQLDFDGWEWLILADSRESIKQVVLENTRANEPSSASIGKIKRLESFRDNGCVVSPAK